MAQSDWTELTDSISSASFARGPTSGVTPPSGGGSFVFAFNALDATPGAAGLLVNLADYNPAAKGASVRGALSRGVSGGSLEFAPFLFAGLQGPTVADLGYLLGLGDGNPAHIILRKGSVVAGLPDNAPGSNGVLRRSDQTFALGTWLHLRLDVIVNLNGDVILKVFRNDLTAHAVTSPTWVAIPGMADFVDDVVQINSGSAPLLNGRMGFAAYKNASARRMYFDHLECLRQL